MKTCLNLGCGLDYRESTETETWINVDNDPYVKTDWCGDACEMPGQDVHNTGVLREYYSVHHPDKTVEDWTDRFDYIYANHSLEHFSDLFEIVDELARVSKNGAIWEVNVPYWSWPTNMGNPHHRTNFNIDTFRFFDQGPNGLHKRRQQNYSIETVDVFVESDEAKSWKVFGETEIILQPREIKFKLKLAK